MIYDAPNLLEAAKAGKPHITGGLSGCHTAFKKAFGVPKGLRCAASTCGTSSPTPTGRRSTARSPAEPVRGVNGGNPPASRIFILYHIRPHGGIGGKTPAEAAGIKIRGHNKWLTPMQNAAGAA